MTSSSLGLLISALFVVNCFKVFLYSCGRDSVICLWDLEQGSRLKTIPVYESLEGMILVPKDCMLPGNYKVASQAGPHVAVAGEKGNDHWENKSLRI
jgi:hypothetical protein